MNVDIIGYSAIGIAAIATLPQLNQICITKKVRDLNFFFFFLRAISSILYFSYGLLKQEYIMMASAIMPIILEVLVLIFYLKYRNIDVEPT